MIRGKDIWSASQYLKFDALRDRPFFELLGRLPANVEPRRVVDLGCGTGHQTAHLADRWPEAQVLGLDSSRDMLEKARGLQSRAVFEERDLRTWQPDEREPPDVLVSNAALHWVAEALPSLLPRWMDATKVLAFQMPHNQDAPSHRLLRELQQSAQWRHQFDESVKSPRVEDVSFYASLLLQHDASLTVDAWETEYFQILPPPKSVLDWMLGTTLRPILAQLDACDSERFLAQYQQLLEKAYPVHAWGTHFPFKRLFVVASKQ